VSEIEDLREYKHHYSAEAFTRMEKTIAQQAEQLMQAQTNSAFFRCCALSGEVPAKGSEPFPPPAAEGE
jgi:hypothetical protein